jgi:hypothetical protein
LRTRPFITLFRSVWLLIPPHFLLSDGTAEQVFVIRCSSIPRFFRLCRMPELRGSCCSYHIEDDLPLLDGCRYCCKHHTPPTKTYPARYCGLIFRLQAVAYIFQILELQLGSRFSRVQSLLMQGHPSEKITSITFQFSINLIAYPILWILLLVFIIQFHCLPFLRSWLHSPLSAGWLSYV